MDNSMQTPAADDINVVHEKKTFLQKVRSGSPKELLISVIAIAFIIGAVYLAWYQSSNGVMPWASDDVKTQAEVDMVVKAVAKHIIVPAGEPILATVNDVEILKAEQPFFRDAINGDQLLMFPDSAQAIIYSPSRDIIVNAGPIQYDDTEAVPAE